MPLPHHIQIKGIQDTLMLALSKEEFAFIMLMIEDRRSEHYFAVGSHIIRFGEELQEVELDDE